MRARTEAEIKAYADGYNACYKQFCECLKENIPKWKAVKKMELFVTAVTSCVEVADTPQTEKSNSEYYLELADAVMRGEMSDASANQAWYEYINKQDTPQTDCGWK